MKLIGEKEMKNRILLSFIFVFFINLVLGILLFKFNKDEIELKDALILLIGSYIVYFALNFYLWFLKKTRQDANYTMVLLVGILVSILSITVLLINIMKDSILYFPLMYISSMFCTFVNWFIYEKFRMNK